MPSGIRRPPPGPCGRVDRPHGRGQGADVGEVWPAVGGSHRCIRRCTMRSTPTARTWRPRVQCLVNVMDVDLSDKAKCHHDVANAGSSPEPAAREPEDDRRWRTGRRDHHRAFANHRAKAGIPLNSERLDRSQVGPNGREGSAGGGRRRGGAKAALAMATVARSATSRNGLTSGATELQSRAPRQGAPSWLGTSVVHAGSQTGRPCAADGAIPSR